MTPLPTITQIGPHRIRCGDALQPDALADLMQRQRAEVVYTDPPWGVSALRMFATMNRKATGADFAQPDSMPDFLGRLMPMLAGYSKRWVMIEYGTAWAHEVLDAAEAHGLYWICTAVTVYGGEKRPMNVHVFSLAPDDSLPSSYLSALDGTAGIHTPLAALTPLVKKGDTILDPFCGLGITADAALRLGCNFRGNEFNSARLAKTEERLRKGTTA